MTKTLVKSRHNPTYKIKLQTQILENSTSSNLLSNSQNLKKNFYPEMDLMSTDKL